MLIGVNMLLFQVSATRKKEEIKYGHEYMLTWGDAKYTILTNKPPETKFDANGKPVQLKHQSGPEQYAALKEMLKDGTIIRSDGTEMRKNNPLRQFMLSELERNANLSLNKETGISLAFRLEEAESEKKRQIKSIGVAHKK